LFHQDNQPVSNPKTQGGLSIVRIRAADPANAFDQIGKMDATFVQNTFQNNKFDAVDDSVSEGIAIIEFYGRRKSPSQFILPFIPLLPDVPYLD
jgi:hypothetical protein